MHGTSVQPIQPSLSYATEPFDPLAELACMAWRKRNIENLLANERERDAPSVAVIAACESWLRIYQADMDRACAARRNKRDEEC